MTPWPDDVYDCAKRLARSLGYREIDISHHKGRISIFRLPGIWRELDPRDPIVWGALIGPHGVKVLVYKAPEFATVIYDGAKHKIPALPASYSATCGAGLTSTHKDIGIAVCEAYNALKGNPRWVYDTLQVWDLEDGADILYSGPPEDRTKYEWIDAEKEKPDTQSYVEVCDELVLFSITDARWVPADTVVVEQPDETTEDSYPSRLRYVFVNQEPYVYEIVNYQPEGWYDLDGKPLTHKVTHWRYKKGRGKNEK